MPHTHANGFLEELKTQENTSERFCMLVEKIISCHGNISEEDKDKIFQKLLENNHIIQPNTEGIIEELDNESVIEETSTKINNESITLTLNKLTHNSGVNALILGGNIPFSDSCTIIYGLNGQGKSGYFRILNELAGGCEICEIKGNIYNDKQDPLNVSIEYTLNGEAETYDYTDKNLRGIPPFNNIRVFDNNYMKHFLNDREIQGNIEPLGLHLFGKITKVIEEYENRIGGLTQEKRGQIQDLESIKSIIHDDELKIILNKTDITNEDIKKIENTQMLTPNETKSLKELKEKLIKLNQSNKEDSLELAKSRKGILEKLKTEIDNFSKINKYIENVQCAFKKHNDALVIRDKKKQELTVLQKIPGNETKEWQSFIESGKKYGEKAKEHGHDIKKKCLYCQQELLKDSLEIVESYSKFLSDTSQTEVENAKQNIDTIKEEIEKTTINCDIPDFLTQEDKENIKTAKETIKNLQKKLVISIQNNKLEEGLNIVETTSISSTLAKKIAQYDKDIEDFTKNKIENEKNIKDIEEQIYKLEDQDRIHTNKEKIKKYFFLNKTLKILEELKFTSFKTAISRKSSEATEKLITQNLIDKFNEILPKIRNDMEQIELRKANTTGGIPHIKLCIKDKSESIEAILSEGEKKAVCLALFFAEILSEGDQIPIILDDPVTSLDHKLSDNVANVIIETGLQKQTIIFTHNQTFLESLIYWGNQNAQSHVCKNYNSNGCNSTGKHILIYTIEKQNSLKTGKVFKYNEQCLDYFIKKAKEELKSNGANATVCHNLKSAIEYYIDEKVFNNQIPRKYSKNKENIYWDQLKQIGNTKYNINVLKTHWDNLSSRGTHLSYQQQNNPLDADELNEIITYLGH